MTSTTQLEQDNGSNTATTESKKESETTKKTFESSPIGKDKFEAYARHLMWTAMGGFYGGGVGGDEDADVSDGVRLIVKTKSSGSVVTILPNDMSETFKWIEEKKYGKGALYEEAELVQALLVLDKQSDIDEMYLEFPFACMIRYPGESDLDFCMHVVSPTEATETTV